MGTKPKMRGRRRISIPSICRRGRGWRWRGRRTRRSRRWRGRNEGRRGRRSTWGWRSPCPGWGAGRWDRTPTSFSSNKQQRDQDETEMILVPNYDQILWFRWWCMWRDDTIGGGGGAGPRSAGSPALFVFWHSHPLPTTSFVAFLFFLLYFYIFIIKILILLIKTRN